MKKQKMEKQKLKKRTWHYIQNPREYEIHCDKCNGLNIEWSEYERLIWCYDCKIDTKGTGGIFDGPIPIGACKVLGISFNRWDMINNCVLTFDEETQEYIKYIPKKLQKHDIPKKLEI
jgi:hypothetical protein